MAYKVDRFAKGSAVFTCQCCNRRTRATNRDHASTGNCEICYELAGIENAFSDYGADEAFADYGVEARKLLAKLQDKNCDMVNWTDLMADLDACEAKAAAPVAPVVDKANRNAKVIVKATGVRVQLRTGEKVNSVVQAPALTAEVLAQIAEWIA